MLLAILAVLNIPVYLLIGWVVFDDPDNAAGTFFETTLAILKTLLIPRIVRELLGIDTEGSWGLLPIAGFVLACAAVVYGQYALIVKWFPAA